MVGIMSDSSGEAVATVAVMGGMYLFVDSIAISVIGGALLGLFLVAATICAVGAALLEMEQNPIRQLWGWLVFFVLAPALLAAPFAFVYYGIMDQHTTVSSNDLSPGKNLELFLSFFWLIADVGAACGLYLLLAVVTEDLVNRKRANVS